MFRSIRIIAALCLTVVIAMGLTQTVKVTNAQTDLKAVVKAYIDASNAAIKSGDGSKLADFYAADYKSEKGTTVADQVKNLESTAKAFPDGVYAIKDIVVEGDKVAVRMTFTGTNNGDLGGLPATKKPVTFEAVALITFKDGKILSDWSLTDNQSLLLQLGFTFTPPAAK